MTNIKRNSLITVGIAFSILLGILLFSANANAATKSFSGSFRFYNVYGDEPSKEIKRFSVTKPGYIYIDLDISSFDPDYDKKFYEDDKIVVHIEGYDSAGKVIYSNKEALSAKEDDDYAGGWLYYGNGKKKIPEGQYKIWLSFGSDMNCYKIKYKLQYFTKVIKRIKLPKKIVMKVGQARYYKIKNKVDKDTFPFIVAYKRSNNKIYDFYGYPTKKAIFLFATKPGKCKVTFMSSYGIKTKINVIIKKRH